MTLRKYAVLAFFLACSGAAAVAGDKHRCNSYLWQEPPELLSQAEQWIGPPCKRPLTLQALRGNVIWLQFNFCEGCTPMRRQLAKWHKRYGRQGLEVVEIDGGRCASLEKAWAYTLKQEVRHHVLWDSKNQNHQRYGVRSWPTAYLIGRDGKVLWHGDPTRVLYRPEQLAMLMCHLEAELQIGDEALKDTPGVFISQGASQSPGESQQSPHVTSASDQPTP